MKPPAYLMNPHEAHRAFMARVEVVDENSCWIWRGPRNHKNYGHFYFGGLAAMAHRFAASGFRMPRTKRLACHRCDNPPCVNPDHLFFATAKDNTLDMFLKGRGGRGGGGMTPEKSRHRKLTRDQVGQSRLEHELLGTSFESLARAYGVHPKTISNIVNKRTWK